MAPFQLAFVGGILVLRYVVTPAAKDCYMLCARRMQRPLWKAGPKLSLPEVLANIARANQLAKRFPQNGFRFRFSLTWRGHASLSLKMLRFSRRLADMLGSVYVDIELIPVSGAKADPAGLGYTPPAAADCALGPGEGKGATSPPHRKCKGDAGKRRLDDTADVEGEEMQRAEEFTAEGAEGAAEGAEPWDDFEDLQPVRVATLQQFYSFIRPSVEQMAVDELYKERLLRGEAAPSADKPSTSAAAESSADLTRTECCICMDHTVQVVTDCGHAFCETCHAKWCETSNLCPLCRSRNAMTRTASGTQDSTYSAYVLAEAELQREEGEDEEGFDASVPEAAAQLMQFVVSLPIASRR